MTKLAENKPSLFGTLTGETHEGQASLASDGTNHCFSCVFWGDGKPSYSGRRLKKQQCSKAKEMTVRGKVLQIPAEAYACKFYEERPNAPWVENYKLSPLVSDYAPPAQETESEVFNG